MVDGAVAAQRRARSTPPRQGRAQRATTLGVAQDAAAAARRARRPPHRRHAERVLHVPRLSCRSTDRAWRRGKVVRGPTSLPRWSLFALAPQSMLLRAAATQLHAARASLPAARRAPRYAWASMSHPLFVPLLTQAPAAVARRALALRSSAPSRPKEWRRRLVRCPRAALAAPRLRVTTLTRRASAQTTPTTSSTRSSRARSPATRRVRVRCAGGL